MFSGVFILVHSHTLPGTPQTLTWGKKDKKQDRPVGGKMKRNKSFCCNSQTHWRSCQVCWYRNRRKEWKRTTSAFHHTWSNNTVYYTRFTSLPGLFSPIPLGCCFPLTIYLTFSKVLFLFWIVHRFIHLLKAYTI